METTAAYSYDAAGRVATVASAADTFSYGYTYAQSGTGPRVGATSGENLKPDFMPYTLTKSASPALQAVRTYQATRDVLAVIENNAGATTRSAYDYSTVNGGVNSLGQRGGVATTFNLGDLDANPGNTSWGYDPLGQVTSANAPGTTADRAYQFDTIGNRLFAQKEAAAIPGTPNQNTTGYTPDALNQYDAITPYDAAGSPGTPAVPVHDPDGNATAYPLPTSPSANRSLVWDAENRLIEVNDGTNPIVTYTYDALSRRISRTAGGTTTLYLYDAWNCIAEYSGSTHALARCYTWGLDLSGTLQGAGGVGGLLAVNIGGTSYYPTYDGNGNISEYLNADGTAAAHFEYDPFGNTTVVAEAFPGLAALFNHRFSTKPLDSLTGFYYYGYRWYDPVTGRWPSRDPIGERGGVNLYGFLQNNAVGGTDTLGLSTLSVDVSCLGHEDILVDMTYLAEEEPHPDWLPEPAKEFRRLPPPGSKVDADALYYGNGMAIKIPDTTVGEIVCWKDCEGDWRWKYTYVDVFDRSRTWKSGDPPPPDWPSGDTPGKPPRMPPYTGKPPSAPYPPLKPRPVVPKTPAGPGPHFWILPAL